MLERIAQKKLFALKAEGPGVADSGDFALRPVTLGLLVHPLRRDRVDFYVGPQPGRASFSIGLNGPPA